MLLNYAAFWLVLAVLATINGLLREKTYGKVVPDLLAHQISTITAILITGAAVWLFQSFQPIGSGREARLIGTVWLAMTITFEFGFGHFVFGHSWRKLFADYNLAAGRVWLLFLAWILVMPPLFYRLSHANL